MLCMDKKILGFLVIGAIAIGAWSVFFNKPQPIPNLISEEVSGEITSFYLAKPNLVVETIGLESVSFYATPADRSLPDFLLGQGALVEEFNDRQTWTFDIPEAILIRKIYTIGTDRWGLNTERQVFPIAGIPEIYKSLWTEVPEKLVKLQLGQGVVLENGKLTFDRVLEDSRCPVNADCIQTGRLAIELSLGEQTFVLSSNDEELNLGNQYLRIVRVFPSAEGIGIKPSEYVVTFSIITNPR